VEPHKPKFLKGKRAQFILLDKFGNQYYCYRYGGANMQSDLVSNFNSDALSELENRIKQIEVTLNTLVDWIPQVQERLKFFDERIKALATAQQTGGRLGRAGYARRTYDMYLRVKKAIEEGVSMNTLVQELGIPYSSVRFYAYATQGDIAKLKARAIAAGTLPASSL
jgi:hypothetical protein